MNNLLSGHVGNGLAIWRWGQNEVIAHITPDRTIKVYKHVSIDDLEQILDLAKNDDRNISVTQDEKVFRTRPKHE